MSHTPMRRLFFILLIALLPLRGWVSDAMATTMGAAQVQAHQQGATQIVAAHARAAGVKAPIDLDLNVKKVDFPAADCPDHAPGGDSHHAADTHCESCGACQACHTLALSSVPAQACAAFHRSTLPRAEVARFASAQAARGQKPPIS